MKSILVLASTYPRWNNDSEPLFVHYLCKQLTKKYHVIALAPHYQGADHFEYMDGVLIHRFRYFFPFGERLAYDGGIISNLKRNRFKLLLVPFFLVGQFVGIVRLSIKYRIKLIHAHWIIPQGLLALMARSLLPGRIRILSTSHGADLYSLKGRILQGLKTFVFRHSDYVTVVSTAMRDHLKYLGCEIQNVAVQPMGVDLTGWFIPNSSVRQTCDLVFVGRLVEKKGVAILIEAFKYLVNDFPSLQLTIVGEGPERTQLEKQMRTLELQQHITMVGAVPNEQVPGYYQSARIAVVPSVVATDGDQEGLGLVAVEAMGCGCATIVSNLPALADVVEDRETGLIFESGNAVDLADKIRRLLVDESLRLRLARKGREYVSSKFDWDEVGQNYIEIIDKCLTNQTIQ